MRKALLDKELFKSRRQRAGQLIPGCALILPAWPEYIRNADSHHNYRAESNLFYMTGFEEPEACLVLRPGKSPEAVMFVRPKNIERETWDGFRFGLEGAKSVYGFDDAFDIADFETVGAELLKGCDRIYYTQFRNHEFDQRFQKLMANMVGIRPRYGVGFPAIEDAHALIAEMRIRKDSTEVEIMRESARICSEAHIEVMKATKPGVSERYLHGIFIKEIMARGAQAEAYGGIFATGNNATTLHYRFNDAICKSGQTLLVDAGAELKYYASDITRCCPVDGKFTPAHERVYSKILKVQKESIKLIKPGLPHAELQKFTVRGLTQILLEEGLLKGDLDELIKANAQVKYYPHGVSHLLGLDVHDAGLLLTRGQSRPIEVGFAMTIEPGLYFPESDPNVPAELKGLGIRIEDDIVVTDEGCEVLTSGAPKEIEAIYSHMS